MQQSAHVHHVDAIGKWDFVNQEMKALKGKFYIIQHLWAVSIGFIQILDTIYRMSQQGMRSGKWYSIQKWHSKLTLKRKHSNIINWNGHHFIQTSYLYVEQNMHSENFLCKELFSLLPKGRTYLWFQMVYRVWQCPKIGRQYGIEKKAAIA